MMSATASIINLTPLPIRELDQAAKAPPASFKLTKQALDSMSPTLQRLKLTHTDTLAMSSEIRSQQSECSPSRTSGIRTPSDFRRLELRRNDSGKFVRTIEAAVRYFGDKKVEIRKEPQREEHDSTEPIEEESQSVDFGEYSNMKRELKEVKQELTEKERQAYEQNRKILKLEFDLRTLKTQVQDPFEVPRGHDRIDKEAVQEPGGAAGVGAEGGECQDQQAAGTVCEGADRA